MKNKGFSLIEVMVAVGILSVLTLGMTRSMSNLNKQMQSMNQKNEISQLHNFLMMGMKMNPSGFCTDSVENKTFNVSDEFPSFDLPKIDLSTTEALRPNSPLPNSTTGLKIGGMQITNLSVEVGNPNLYKGDFQIEIDKDSTVGTMKPIVISYLFNVDPASPPSARKVTGCVGNTTSCALPQFQTGTDAGGNAVCNTMQDYITDMPNCRSGTVLVGFNAGSNGDLSPVCVVPRVNNGGSDACSPRGLTRTSNFCGFDGWTYQLRTICQTSGSGEGEDGARWALQSTDADGTNRYHRLFLPQTPCTL